MALLKAFNKEVDIEWIEERKENLMLTPSVTKSAEKDIIDKSGKELDRERGTISSEYPDIIEFNSIMEFL